MNIFRNNFRKIYSICILFFVFISACTPNKLGLNSPDQTGKLILFTEKGLQYSYEFEGQPIITLSDMGYQLDSLQRIPDANWTFQKLSETQHDSIWKPLWGKRSEVPDKYQEIIIGATAPSASTSPIKKLQIQIRLYNDGLAFRYIIPEGEPVNAASELTQFNFSSDPTAWFYNGEYPNYGPVLLSEVDTIRPSNVTLKTPDSLYLCIHEANLIEGAPLVFHSKKGETSLEIASKPGVQGQLKAGYTSAWRVVMVGKTPGALVDSHLLELLNPDPQMDFSWVKPGVALWDWRIDGAEWEGFKYTMSYPSWVRMIDFAAEQGFVALVLDANWYGPEHETKSDPIKGEKANDVQRIIKYGKDKNVGVWLYLNDVGGKQFPIEETLKKYGEWGAAGVKYGFMTGTPEEKNLWTQKITRLCAENHLLVDFHDMPVHPYGQLRTWPNAVTREFCHAQLDAHRVFLPSTFCTSVFVNMVTGPIDMNNGFFDLRQGNTTRVDENKPVPSTVVAEAARTQIVFSGMTIIPDIPEYYHKYPPLLEFITAQKMPWIESKTIDGKIGEYIVMARQSAEEKWLIGAATNEEGRTISVPLSFLGQGEFTAKITEDGEDAHYLTNKVSLKYSIKKVTKNDILVLKLAPGGGACVIID